MSLDSPTFNLQGCIINTLQIFFFFMFVLKSINNHHNHNDNKYFDPKRNILFNPVQSPFPLFMYCIVNPLKIFSCDFMLTDTNL